MEIHGKTCRTALPDELAHAVDDKTIHWENYAGDMGETAYDFAMLIPQFTGQPITYIGHDGSDVSAKVVTPAGFVQVDAVYGLNYATLRERPDAWPATYQNPSYPSIFAAGIGFAPPGPISAPHTTRNGTSISAAPPRTGMIAGGIGRITALNSADLVTSGTLHHRERMTETFAAVTHRGTFTPLDSGRQRMITASASELTP